MRVGGAKNAALPILAATLLDPGEHRCATSRACATWTRWRGCSRSRRKVERRGDEHAIVATGELSGDEAPYELVKTMRASVLVLGPLLARSGQARGLAPRGLRDRQRR